MANIREKIKKLDSKELIVKQGQDFFSPIVKSLKPSTVLNYLQLAERGQLYYQAKMFAKLEEDGRIRGTMGTRKAAVANLSWDVLPYIDQHDDSAAQRNENIASFCKDVLLELNIESVIKDILDSIGTGYSHNIIHWRYLDGALVPIEIEWIDRSQFQVDTQSGEFQVYTEDNQYVPIAQFQERLISHYHKSKSGHPAIGGLYRALALYYSFKRWDLKDWAIAIERYAQPPVIGEYEDETSKDAVIAAAQALGVDSRAAYPKGSVIKLLETARSINPALFTKFIDYCDNEICITNLGQTLTTAIGDSGSYAAAKTHNLVRQDILEDDAKQVQGTKGNQLMRPMVVYNFGEQKRGHYPKFKIKYEPPEDLLTQSQIDNVMVDIIDIPADDLRKKYDYRKPEEGEEIAGRNRQAPADPFGFEAPNTSPPLVGRASRLPAGQDARPTGRSSTEKKSPESGQLGTRSLDRFGFPLRTDRSVKRRTD